MKLLRNTIAFTDEIYTWELKILVAPDRSMKIFCLAA
jgi:hypothetical protein